MSIQSQKQIFAEGYIVRLALAWLAWLGVCGPLSAAELKTLPGHIPPAARQLKSIGALPDTNRIRLALGLPLRKPAELTAFLDDLYNPKSPRYRQYITPEQFADTYGPALADYQAVTDFARQNNLEVRTTYTNRMVLDVMGSVTDIQRAFQVSLKVYHHPTEARDFYAPDREPSVPINLPLADISGLNNFSRPHPMNLSTNPAAVGPRTGSGADGSYIGKDFREAYAPNVKLTGAGQIVGLLEFSGYYVSDVTAYEEEADIAALTLQNVPIDEYEGEPTSEGDPEVSLDIEMVASLAPGVSKVYVFDAGPTGYPNDLLAAMASSFEIKQFSCSWGWNGGPENTTGALFQEMMAQGQSFFTASGDSDSFTVGAASVNGVDNPYLDNSPSSSPYITSVGGTTLTTTNEGEWSAETVWNSGAVASGVYKGSSGGVSSAYPIPAWQKNVSMNGNGGSYYYRNIPDVAACANNVLVYCSDGETQVDGGTSCAAPLWAAFTALVNEQAVSEGRPTVGFVNPAIYSLATGPNYGEYFHDVTNGNNIWAQSGTNYSATFGYDLCTGWGTPAGQPLITALANYEPLQVSPNSGFSSVGYVGGPFNTNSETFSLTNLGSSSINWSLAALPAWLTATATSGMLAAHAGSTVTISLSGEASSEPAGTYTNDVSFADTTTGVDQAFQVVLQTVEALAIEPANGLSISGQVGGPFTFSGTNISLANMGSSPVVWSMNATIPGWLKLTPTSGTLPQNSSTNVTVALTSSAKTTAGGAYNFGLTFEDFGAQVTQTIPLAFGVGQSVLLNGGFETGSFADWTLVGDTADSEATYNAVEPQATYPEVVHTGGYGALLGDDELATLTQPVTTIPGQTYLLSFWLDNPESGAGQQFLVNWITNSGTASRVYFITNPPALGWTNLSFVLPATGTNTQLQFGAENAPNYFGLDDVSLTPIPNPAPSSVTRSGTSLSLSLYTVPGIDYELLYATNLAQTNWIPVATNLASATTLTFSNNVGTNKLRYYRVLQLP